MKTLKIPAAALAAMLILAACSGGDDAATTAGDSYDSRYRGETATTIATGFPAYDDSGGGLDGDVETPPSAEDVGATNAQAVVATVDAITLGRQIIFTANLQIEVDDVVAAGAQVENAIAGLGGILFGQETTTGDNPRSVLTIKVLPENFDEALNRLAGVGELISQSVFADDVTDRVVDLESRIATSEISVARLQTLLEGAVGIEDVVALETELLQRETDLEVLRGQLRTLQDAVSLATIVVVLTEPVPDVPEPALELTQTAYAGIDTGNACPGVEELTIDEGEPMTVCFEIVNTGDTALSDIRLRDYGLDMDETDTVVVEGDLNAPLMPGGRLILAFQTEADPDQYTSVEISATPVDEDGDPLRIGVQTKVSEAYLDIIRDDSLPGFRDSLSAAWDAFLKVVGVVVVAAGAVIPFLWVPIIAAGVWWWRKRRTSTPPPAA